MNVWYYTFCNASVDAMELAFVGVVMIYIYFRVTVINKTVIGDAIYYYIASLLVDGYMRYYILDMIMANYKTKVSYVLS